eukprot:203056_1
MDPFTSFDNTFHWQCGTKMEEKSTICIGNYERSRLGCCGCFRSFKEMVTYYECTTCSIPTHTHSRDSTPYPVRYCQSCLTSANYQLASVNNVCRAIYLPCTTCICGGTLKPKVHDALQAIGHWSFMRDNINTPYRYIKLLCNGCLETIDPFSIYVSCSNNRLCMAEHSDGFRYCLYCVENLDINRCKANEENSKDEDDESEEEDHEEEEDEHESSIEEKDSEEEVQSNSIESVTYGVLLLSKIHALWWLSIKGFELDVADKELIENKDYCELIRKEMHRLMRQKQVGIKKVGYISIKEMHRLMRQKQVGIKKVGYISIKETETMKMFDDERFAVPLMYHVFGYCINHYMAAVRLSRVNTFFHSLLTFKGKKKVDMEVYYLSDIWKRICFVQWPPLEDIVKHKRPANIKHFKTRWDIYYRIRFDKLKQKHLDKQRTSRMTDIEDIKPFHYQRRKMSQWIANCETEQEMEVKIEDEIWDKVLPDGYQWKVKCPLFMDQLKWQQDISAYYC